MMARAVRQRVWIPLVALWMSACGSARSLEPTPAQRTDSAEAREPAPDPERTALERAVRAIAEAPGSPAPAVLSSEELTQVFDYYCGSCHNPRGNLDLFEGLLFTGMEQLIEAGKVIPGNADATRFVARIRAGEMPPSGSGVPPVPEATTARIAVTINALPPRPPAEPPPPPDPGSPSWRSEPRPNVPPVQSACFSYLGDWIRCEHEGRDPLRVDIPGRDLERCLQACLEDPECVAVTDYTWLDLPELGCYLYLASCDTPGPGVWHEEDGGRQYLKSCP